MERSRARKILRVILLTFLACVGFVFVYSANVIGHAPKIDTSDIYSYLSVSSTLYDDEGNQIDSVYSDAGNRENLDYDEMPEDLINSVVAIEDKTFWEHHGFNIIRIFGAIKDSLVSGGNISGTSSITQQLARNVYLADSKSVRSMNRKVTEAWYTVLLEKDLSKEEIMEAYLNTIYLGYNSYGVQAAAQAYFSKDATDLNLVECASLAAIPSAPDVYAPVKNYSSSDFTAVSSNYESDDILSQTSDYVTVYNGDASKDRRDTTIKYLNEQGYISEDEMNEALDTDLRSEIELKDEDSNSSYYSNYVIDVVINDLVESGYEESEARSMVYSGGLKIYTTMNTQAQEAIEEAFEDASNFPSVSYTANSMDSQGNIYDKDGNSIILYSKDAMLPDGVFTFEDDEYKKNEDGSLTLYANKRLNFYDTTANGTSDITVEFKPMWTENDGAFYVTTSSSLVIPSNYKSYDSDGNVVVSKEFFDDYPNVFAETDGGLTVPEEGYTLQQEVRQPQAAMVICDNETGAIKAMVGGRDATGQLLYNRATSTRQPGSSIKPLAVYSAALQIGADAAANNSPLSYTNYDKNQKSEGYGDYWTAYSKINDAELTVDGKVWPENSYDGYKGILSMRNAIRISSNVCAVRVYQQVGSEYAAKQLKKFGITSVVEDGDTNDMNASALALGGMTSGVSPLEMASAYTTFPSLGTHTEYSCYTQVTDSNGDVLLVEDPEQTEVLDPGVAWITADMLRTVVASGTGTGAATSQVTAGKTGTTSDNYDAWFCGFTPQYSAALWIGNDVNVELSEGSAAAARLWGKIMENATSGMTGEFMEQPDEVVYTNGEYFVDGTQEGLSTLKEGDEDEEDEEDLVKIKVCTESGYKATDYCPVVEIKEVDKNSKIYKTTCPVHPVPDDEEDTTDDEDDNTTTEQDDDNTNDNTNKQNTTTQNKSLNMLTNPLFYISGGLNWWKII